MNASESIERHMRDETERQTAPVGGSSFTPKPEVCICAAIRFADGYIVRGHRHHDCLRSAGEIERCKGQGRGMAQGFMTTSNRFVDRAEGLALQRAAGMPSANGEYQWQLYSEDLY